MSNRHDQYEAWPTATTRRSSSSPAASRSRREVLGAAASEQRPRDRACEGPAGPAGLAGGSGSDSTEGTDGQPGAPGAPTDPSPWLTGPGIEVTIIGATIGTTGAKVAFKLTGGAGVAL